MSICHSVFYDMTNFFFEVSLQKVLKRAFLLFPFGETSFFAFRICNSDQRPSVF